MSSETPDVAKKRFVVSIYEVRQEIVFAEVFSGQYVKTVTLSDGTTRTVELTPTSRQGQSVVELNDTGYRNYMGIARVGTCTQVNGNLMVKVYDFDDRDTVGAELNG